MKAIAAVDRHWGIGKDGGMLFRLPQDLAFFKTTTLGKTVVMGRATLASFKDGKPLPKRNNIVLSRNPSFAAPGVTVSHSLPQLLATLAAYPTDEIFVIGGGSVYELLLPYCDTALVTHVEDEAPADSFFPALDTKENWQFLTCGQPLIDGEHTIRFCTYVNARPKALNEIHGIL